MKNHSKNKIDEILLSWLGLFLRIERIAVKVGLVLCLCVVSGVWCVVRVVGREMLTRSLDVNN